MKIFLKLDQMVSIILRIFSSYSKISKAIQNDFENLIKNLVDILFQFSSNDYGLELILETFDTNK
jgi:hypothetical protein